MEAKRAINGTWGEVWLDGEKMSECHGLQAKVSFKKEDVPICGSLAMEKKIVGWDGTGSLKLYKVSSRMGIKLQKLISEGKDLRFIIISKLADPDSVGAERVAIKNVSFDDIMLADWMVGAVGKTECPFTFSKYEYLDKIN